MHSQADRQSFLQTQARHVRQCWREAKFVAWVWGAAIVYCCTVIVTMGYIAPDQRPEIPSMLWGIPTWVIWGVVLPWLVLIGVTWLFAALVLKDDEPYMDFPEGGPSGEADQKGGANGRD